MNRAKSAAIALAASLIVPLAGGCVAGPSALQISRSRYNKAIQKTRKEQLLLNLVRLQYREEPLFLEVGSVAAQFVFRATGDIGGTLREGPSPAAHQLDLDVGFGFEERPTITLTPLQGKDFVQRLLMPLELDVILWLTRSGWSLDRVLRLTVQNINGWDNASSASGPTPLHPPRYEGFARITALFRELQTRGLLNMVNETRHRDLSGPMPASSVSLDDILAAERQGYSLRPTDDGAAMVLTETSQALVWNIPPEAAEVPEVREIIELLGLAPDRHSYEIRVGLVNGGPPSSANGGNASSPGGRTEIRLATRSLMGTMFYLSQSVVVPESHRKKGLVTTTTGPAGEPFDWSLVTGDLLRIHSRSRSPSGPAVAVPYRGHWYYVDDTDLTSKSTLALLGQLFSLQAGQAATAAPVLTLPVGG